MKWELKDGVLSIDGTRFSPPSGRKVEKAILRGNVLVVLLDHYALPRIERNVLGLDSNGQVLWEIEAVPPFLGAPMTYWNLYVEGESLIAYSSMGGEFIVDIANGKRRVKNPDERPW